MAITYEKVEYNGFSLNNETSGIITTEINGVDVPVNNITVERGVFEGRKILNQNLRKKEISWSGYIKRDTRSDAEQVLDDINRNCLYVGVKDLVIQWEGGERTWEVYTTGIEGGYDNINGNVIKLSMTFFTENKPFAEGSEEIFNFNHQISNNSVTIDFQGTYEPRPVIEITNKGGIIKLIDILNEEQESQFETQVRFEEDDVIKLDMESPEITFNGDDLVYNGVIPFPKIGNNNYIFTYETEKDTEEEPDLVWFQEFEGVFSDVYAKGVYVYQGVAYVASTFLNPSGEGFVAVDAGTGAVIYTKENLHTEEPLCITVNNNTVITGARDEKVVASTTEDGTKLWEAHEHTDIVQDVDAENGVVVSCGSDNRVIAYDLEDGSKLWEHNLHNGSVLSLSIHDGVVYTGDNNALLIAFDIDSETELWRDDTNHDNTIPALFANDTALYVHSGLFSTERVYAQELDNGNVIWENAQGVNVKELHVENNIIFLGTTVDNDIVALDAEDGEQLWKKVIDEEPITGVYSENGRLFVTETNSDGGLKAYDSSENIDIDVKITYKPRYV